MPGGMTSNYNLFSRVLIGNVYSGQMTGGMTSNYNLFSRVLIGNVCSGQMTGGMTSTVIITCSHMY